MIAKPFDLKERTFLFAVRILNLAAMLPENNEARIVRKQIARSGSAIGSNVEEADGSETKPEKRRMLILARREARETRYWLRIIRHLWSPGISVDADVNEVSEIVKILRVIVGKLKGPA